MTWNDDGICSPCHRLLDLFALKRSNSQLQQQEDEYVQASIRESAKARHPAGQGYPEH
jgi:hypothetical protein